MSSMDRPKGTIKRGAIAGLATLPAALIAILIAEIAGIHIYFTSIPTLLIIEVIFIPWIIHKKWIWYIIRDRSLD
jgi:hypothetical protein